MARGVVAYNSCGKSERAAQPDEFLTEEPSAGDRWWTPARTESLLWALGAGAVLAVARLLTPEAGGYGTHEHLFLLPCIFRWATGLPCPFCGMTTAFALMAHGRVGAAFAIHVLGPAAYLTTWAALGAAIVGLVRNRMLLPRWPFSQTGGRVILTVLLLGWAVNLMRLLL